MNHEEGNYVEESSQPAAFSAEDNVEANYVHPQSKKLFDVAPCIRHIPVAGSAIEAFGPACTMSLATVYTLSKGISKNILSLSTYGMFITRFNTDAATQQRMVGIGSMGFSIKPAMAIFSDTFAFLGYTKRWYMAASCLIAFVCILVFGLLPANESSVQIAAALLFLALFAIANIDVLSEGHYSRLIKKYPKPGAHLISWIWAFIMLGNIIAAAIQGPLSDANLPQVGLFIACGTVGVCSVFFIFNTYDEQPNSVNRHADFEDEVHLIQNKPAPFGEVEDSSASERGAEPVDGSLNDQVTSTSETLSHIQQLWVAPKSCCGVWEVNKGCFTNNLTVNIYGLLLTACAITLAILTIVGSTYQLLYGCVVISVALAVSGFILIPVHIMKTNLFGWIQLCSYISISGGIDNFFLADEECVPGGPHFSQTFYYTLGSVIGNIAGLVGVYCFAIIFSKRSYRLTCIVTTVVLVVASIFDLIIVKRWNRPNMPDHAMYILGDAIVYQVCYMLNFMPLNILISRLCPKGCESTMFAILASFSNLGSSTSSTIGTILMETVWPIDIKSTPCNFDNLPWLIITGHLICPLISIPLVFLLLPGDRICDDLDPKMVEAVPLAQKWINNWRGQKPIKQLAEEAEELP